MAGRAVVIRNPCFQEDAGRIHLMVICATEKEAEEWIRHYCSDGFFSRRNFSVLLEPAKNS